MQSDAFLYVASERNMLHRIFCMPFLVCNLHSLHTDSCTKLSGREFCSRGDKIVENFVVLKIKRMCLIVLSGLKINVQACSLVICNNILY